MFYIVNQDDIVLAVWDAWYIHAEDEAAQWIMDHEVMVIDDEITFMGDRVVHVKEVQ